MLEPYRVLDLSDERGLSCGLILADLGADVIAVEPPAGSSARRIGPFAGDTRDPERSLYWWAYSRNKRGVTLDLESSAADRDRFRDLARTSDVVIESFDPGYLDQLDLGYQTLSAINPRLVLVSISPFGQTGPKAGWAAADLTAFAASGVLLLTGDEDRPPVYVPGGQAALHAGGEAAVGVLAALAARARDGSGQHVDVSMQTATMMATQSFILTHGWNGDPVTRIAGGVVAGPLRIRFVYPCKDGHVSVTFLFGNTIGPFTRRLFSLMHEEGFVDEATRDKDWVGYVPLILSGAEPVSEMERCTAAVERFTRSHTKAELSALAMQHGLLIVPTNTTADLLASPQYNDRGYWVTATGAVCAGDALHNQNAAEAGQAETRAPDQIGDHPVIYPGPFARFNTTPVRYRRPAPRLGEHNAELFAALGAASVRPEASGPARARQRERDAGAPPLAGLKVLDFTWVVAGPLGVRYLVDLGALVVHIESSHYPDALRGYGPFKDGLPGADRSGLYHNVSAGKLGLSLNLAQPGARALALRLAAWADVVIENYAPGAMRKWGLHYEALREVNPGVIMLSTCLNGQTGPESGLAGFGTMGAALAGFHELTGWPDRPPAGPFVAYTDYTAPKYIATAVLAALDHRRRTGEGQYIDLAQAEVGMHFLAPALLDYTVNGRIGTRAGNASPDFAPHGVYPCLGPAGPSGNANDRWVAIACTNERQWQALCKAAGELRWQDDRRFATREARLANRVALDETIAAWTAQQEVDAVERALQAADVPAHRALSSEDLFADPQIAHRGHLAWVDHPELGSVPLETSRLRFSRTAPQPPVPGPTFGEHNEFVLRELLDLSDEEIAEVVLSGALD